MRANGLVLLSLGVLASFGSGALVAQTAISADGVVESTSGGFKFPDGSLQATAATAGAPVEDSGQTTCWDETGASRACTGTGEDGESQAGVAWPTPRFTDNSDGTVTDNLTGLIWLKDANCHAGTGMTWQEALDWILLLNTTGIACTDYTPMTQQDWRLPNIKELRSLVDHGQSNPSLPLGHPFVSVQLDLYYSSSTFVHPNRWDAWAVSMEWGADRNALKTGDLFVWPVRGGQ